MRKVAADLAEAAPGSDDQGQQRAKPDGAFPRETISGHIEGSTINEQHNKARLSAQLPEVVIYDFRHTRITRWAKVLPLSVVQRLAEHTSIATTMRYVHIDDDDVVAAMAKEEESKIASAEAKRVHSRGHSEDVTSEASKVTRPNA